jgi:hypothetical protein
VLAAAMAAVVATAMGGCGSELTSSPGTQSTSTTSTAPPTTTVAPTTTPDTTAAPTTLPATTTTTSTLPAGPAAVTTPFFVGSGTGAWLELGAWRVDAWEQAEDSPDGRTGITVEAGTTLTVTNLRREQEAAVGATAEACEVGGLGGRTGPVLDVGQVAPVPPAVGYGAVALLPPEWPLKPRPVAATGAAVTAYQQLGQTAFAGAPVDASLGRVVQTVIADLDGDGDDEAVVAFEHVPNPGLPGSPGDLAALLLVDTESRTATTLLREFVPTTADQFSDGLISQFRVVDVSDLNGDGRMEIVVNTWYFEGAAVVVYEYVGDDAEIVMTAGCGV